MGRLPKPSSLKILEGTQRADRINPAEPQAATLEVGTKPPAWLRGARRRRAWCDLVTLLRDARVLTVLDALALAELVDAHGDYLEASDVVAGRACGLCGRLMTSPRRCSSGEEHEPGDAYFTTRTREGSLMIRPHPAMAVRANAWDRVVKMLDRFGMAPAPRARVSAGKADEHDPVADFLDGRRRA